MCLQAPFEFGSPFLSVVRFCLPIVQEEGLNKHPLFAVSELLATLQRYKCNFVCLPRSV